MPDDANNDDDVYDATLDPVDDPDATPVDPGVLTDAQQTLQQDEQAEAQAAAAGDYATANTDAQQAYGASQDVANAGGPDSTDQTWQAAQNESWANWDQETANQDAATAASYADSATPDDAQIYADAAQNEQGNADNAAEAGEYGDPLGPAEDTVTGVEDAPADDAAVEDAPAVDDTPVEEAAPVEDDVAVDDDSSAT
jgi:hypothetical protein